MTAEGSLPSKLDEQVTYDPNHLLDSLIDLLHLKNDAALSRALEVAPPVITKIRHHRLPVGASLLIRMHEVSALTIAELRALMGDRREKFRISGAALSKSAAKATAASLTGSGNLPSGSVADRVKELGRAASAKEGQK